MNFINQLLENLIKEKCIHLLKTIFGDLVDMQLLSKFNKGIRFLLCVIDLFSKYAFVVPLKDEKVVSIVNAFQSILDKSGRKPNKIWVDQRSQFIIIILNNGWQIMKLVCTRRIMKESL